MKINNDKSVSNVERGSTPASETGAAPPRADRVSLEESQKVAQAVDVARNAASGSRALRLRQIEDAVRSGGYRPNPSRVADEILAAAEIELRLRAISG